MMLVCIWLGLHWVLSSFFDHCSRSSANWVLSSFFDHYIQSSTWGKFIRSRICLRQHRILNFTFSSVQFKHGIFKVQTWYIQSPNMVYSKFKHGIFKVQTWYIQKFKHGIFKVQTHKRTKFKHGVFKVQTWYIQKFKRTNGQNADGLRQPHILT